MKEIPVFNKKTNQEYKVKVDDEDFDKVNQFKWTFHPSGYVRSNKNVMMHHLIIGNKSSEGLVVDHINQDKLDNRKENLRHATKSQNSQNTKRKNKLGYTGIFKNKSNKYVASIRDLKNEKIYRCKPKETPEEAGKQYDILAFNICGKNALTNGLITFDEALKIDIQDIISKTRDRDLPKYIFKYKSYYYVKGNYKTFFFRKRTQTLEQALIILDEINEQIYRIKCKEEEDLQNLPITKDEYGCYILTNKNIKIYVDEKYWHSLIKFTWDLNADGYAYTTVKTQKFTMHRLIMENFENMKIGNNVVDHINHKRIDNRVENLRIVSHSENNQNRKKKQGTLSKYIGVEPSGGKWCSSITYQKKKYHLGSYQTQEEAAEVYNKKALELYGEQAKINIIKA